MNDKARLTLIATVLERLNAAWPKHVISDESYREWYGQCGHLTMETANATVDLVIQTQEWFPTISKFLDLSRSIRRHEIDSSREANKPLPEHIIELQRKGLSVQRDVAQARAGREPHNHHSGWENCPICSQASTEAHADECHTCFLLEAQGLQAAHFTGKS